MSPRLRILPIPESRPPIISADEAYAPVRKTGYVQDSLALNFDLDQQVLEPDLQGNLPDPQATVTRLSQAFLEVIAGLRPPAQVVRFVTPEVHTTLARRSAVAIRRPQGARRPAVVRRVRAQLTAPGVLEAAVVIVHPDRVAAMAMRLVGCNGQWQVTELQLG